MLREGALSKRVDEALFKRLLASSPIPLIGSAIGSALVVMSQCATDQCAELCGWLALVYAVLLFRFIWVRYCQRIYTRQGYSRTLLALYSLSIVLSGCSWGVLGVLIYDGTPSAIIVGVTAIQAMVMGSVVTMSYCILVFLCFSLPAILPLIVTFALGQTMESVVIAVYSSIFLMLMIGVAIRFHRSFYSSQQISFDNADLIDSLKHANETILAQNTELRYLAHHDQLTGLPNRKLLDHHMQQAMPNTNGSLPQVAVLYLDLNGFKPINDSLGHDAGDMALVDVAQRLRSVTSDGDVVARVGGDEFVILAVSEADVGLTAGQLAECCLRVFEAPFEIKSQRCELGVSIGIACAGPDETPDQLLTRADRAMYQAKKLGSRQCYWG